MEIGGTLVKYNDDGEPGGTAGAPMLKIILEKGLSNTLVIVTRYFGGILLGTGGLVRCYSGALEKALEKAEIVTKTKGYEAKIQVEYDSFEALKYYLEKMNIKVINVEYLDKVEVTIDIIDELSNKFTNEYNNTNFKITKYNIQREKFVEI